MTLILKKLLKLIFCHLLGDYVLQTAYIAQKKQEPGNRWHLLVHCTLYILPFFLAFGMDWHLLVIWAAHLLIDWLKAQRHLLSECADQAIHFLTMLVYFL